MSFSTTTESQGIYRNRNIWCIQSKKKSSKITLEKDRIADLLDKDFKTTFLKMLKELKEDVEKVYIPCVNKIEILIKENRKPKKKPKRNS